MIPYLNQWPIVLAAVLALLPLFWFGFSPARLQSWQESPRSVARAVQLALPSLLCVPYLIVAFTEHSFRGKWFLLYLLLPVLVAALLMLAAQLDPQQQGHWLEFVVLLTLGLSVDLRWFEGAWPHGLAAFNKVLLLDAGLYGFLTIRRLTGVGFDLRLRTEDWKVGLREWVFYAPIAIALGLALGFLHWHGHAERAWLASLMWLFTFFLIAVPEEIFFRGWMQNLLERRMGRAAALVVTSILFGLSHFNKRTVFFNWRYVLLAAIAGIFYGRAWRAQRRIGASAITHATVDTLWGLLLR